ncbi:hypothetical protein SDC9_198333 [bioreactor metagenome]|uniref:Uncharacterized protein n=1 Tax=bioreactor metagenome TaxID=1076179 RepID=A0A645IHD8_9ZZZZ
MTQGIIISDIIKITFNLISVVKTQPIFGTYPHQPFFVLHHTGYVLLRNTIVVR